MEAMDPLEFDDAEVTLPDVTWGWNDTLATAAPEASGPLQSSVRQLVLLPAVAHSIAKSEDKEEEEEEDKGDVLDGGGEGDVSPTPVRRKRSPVATFLYGLKDSITGGDTVAAAAPTASFLQQQHATEAAPPILAALESISSTSKRPENFSGDSGGRSPQVSPPKPSLQPLSDHDVSRFRFVADRSSSCVDVNLSAPASPSPPKQSPDGTAIRTRGRVQSVTGSISPLDFRSELARPPPDQPIARQNRPQRSTKASIQTNVLVPAGGGSASSTTQTPSRSDGDDSVGKDLDPSAGYAIQQAVGGFHAHASAPSASTCTARYSDFSQPSSSFKSPRSLPPIVGREPPSPPSPARQLSSNLSLSPRKPHPSAADATEQGTLPTCVACGTCVYLENPVLALGATHVVHRACFRCVTCQELLTLANFHQISGHDSAAFVPVREGIQRFVCTTHYVERLEAMHNPEG